MTSKFGTPIGPIRENPEKRAMLFETMREVVAVGRAKGVPLRPDFAEDRLAFCETIPAKMTSSMQVDLKRGRFCYMPSIARSLVPIVAGLSGVLAGQPLIPLDLSHQITRHFKLPGVVGPLAMVASSVDMAMWDALAIAADMPLASFLGASPRQVPAYNSTGWD